MGDPNENALAERAFRTLEYDLRLHGFINFSSAETAVGQAIRTYNSLRPHASLNYQTPNQAHRQVGHQRLKWYPYGFGSEMCNCRPECRFVPRAVAAFVNLFQ